jgi:hypothetical protein
MNQAAAVGRVCHRGRDGWAGRCAVCVFKGSISPDSLHVSKSVDALMMAAGRRANPAGPGGWRGHVHLAARHGGTTDYWRAVLGAIILDELFPMGIAGFIKQWVPLRWGGGRGA